MGKAGVGAWAGGAEGAEGGSSNGLLAVVGGDQGAGLVATRRDSPRRPSGCKHL